MCWKWARMWFGWPSSPQQGAGALRSEGRGGVARRKSAWSRGAFFIGVSSHVSRISVGSRHEAGVCHGRAGGGMKGGQGGARGGERESAARPREEWFVVVARGPRFLCRCQFVFRSYFSRVTARGRCLSRQSRCWDEGRAGRGEGRATHGLAKTKSASQKHLRGRW